ncbi:MAG: hypothetical protein AAFP77_27630 [Bacteroidota bacterium]
MNALRLIVLLSAITLMTSCGDEDEGCAKANWIGTYTGTVIVNGNARDATATIVDMGEIGIRFSWESSASASFGDFPVDGCFLDRSRDNGISFRTYTLTLDGDQLSHRDETESYGLGEEYNIFISFEGTRD